MNAYQKVKAKLDELGIEFDVVEHPPAFTTEQADSYIEGLEGVRTKTIRIKESSPYLRHQRLLGSILLAKRLVSRPKKQVSIGRTRVETV